MFPTHDRNLVYLTGFGNEFATEAEPGALPIGRNSPQRPPLGLYAEQHSGTPFTVPRDLNRRTWMYRIQPSALHTPFQPANAGLLTNEFGGLGISPNQLRWDPFPIPKAPTDFIQGMVTLGGNGSPLAQAGCAIHMYAANQSMQGRYFGNVDAEMLIAPQQGRLHLATEMGLLEVEPEEIVVIPKGVRFRVDLLDGPSRGYVCENFGAPFRLPDLGPIGSNGLANARDFLIPVAWYEDLQGPFELLNKFAGQLWRAETRHSPLDVVAWHGNCTPYKYDLRRFNSIGSISYDHPDPSIFLVLQAQSDTAGADFIDFIIFPDRWLVMQDTFRPPWYHRNIASEFTGNIKGTTDTKAYGWSPGGAALHNSLISHGPDAESFKKATASDTQKPEHFTGGMTIMFETKLMIQPTRFAMECPQLQAEYFESWTGLKRHFKKP